MRASAAPACPDSGYLASSASVQPAQDENRQRFFDEEMNILRIVARYLSGREVHPPFSHPEAPETLVAASRLTSSSEI